MLKSLTPSEEKLLEGLFNPKCFAETLFTEGVPDGWMSKEPCVCISKGSKIIMFNGSLKNIEDINVGDEILSVDSEHRYIKDIIVNKISSGIKKTIELQCGNNSLRLTPKHKVLSQTIGRSEYKWRKTKDLINHNTKYIKYYKNEQEYLEGQLFGLIVADGSFYITRKGNRERLALYQNIKCEVDAIDWLLNKLTKSYHKYAVDNLGNFHYRIDFGNKWKAKSKYYKECVTKLDIDRDFQLGFISGFLLGDGHYDRTNMMWKITQKEGPKSQLLEKVLTLLDIHYSWCKNPIHVYTLNSFSLLLYNEQSRKFRLFQDYINLKYFSLISNRNRDKIQINNDIKFIECYDLTTTQHAFIANGIIVHNCIRLYQIPFLQYDTVIEDDNRLTKQQNFDLRKKTGELFVICGRLIGKTYLALGVNIIQKGICYTSKQITCGAYDLAHIKNYVDKVCNIFDVHPFFKKFKKSMKRGNPEFEIMLKNGNQIVSINTNVKGKNPGQGFWGKHSHFHFSDEHQAETEKSNEPRIDSISEFGSIDCLCGIPMITKSSPLGKIFKDSTKKNHIVRLPQYVNKNFTEEKRIERIKQYGGESTLGFLVNVEAKLIEGEFGAFDMAKIRNCYVADKTIKLFEVTPDNYSFFEQDLIIEPYKNASKVFIFADIGDTTNTEIGIVFKVGEKYHSVYRITTFRLSLTKELPNLLFWLYKKFNNCYLSLDACFDDKTEILTNCGWKTYKTINKKDKVLSLNPETGVANYKKIDDIYINENYEGEMYQIKDMYNQKISFKITPEHKLLTHMHNHTKNWQLNKIKDLVDSKVERFYLKQDCKWYGKNKKVMIIKGKKQHNAPQITAIKIDMNLWLQFLGWFVSEGFLGYNEEKSKFLISICQVKEKGRKEIEKMLRDLGISFYYTKQTACYHFSNRIIAQHLLKYCYFDKNNKRSRSKQVPEYVKTLTSQQIRIFLDAFCNGDGTRNKNGSKTYFTTSQHLVDDLQELILKVGNRSSVRSVTGSGFPGYKNSECFRIQEFKDTEREVSVYNKNIEKVSYKGVIWCVETSPHHTLFIRREGKVFWSGNTTMGKAVYERMVDLIPPQKVGDKIIDKVIWLSFSENMLTGYEKDEDGNFKRDEKTNEYIKKYEHTKNFCVQLLRDFFFDGLFVIPEDDYSFDEQFSSYMEVISGNRIAYQSLTLKHIPDSWQVLAKMIWDTEFLSDESNNQPSGAEVVLGFFGLNTKKD